MSKQDISVSTIHEQLVKAHLNNQQRKIKHKNESELGTTWLLKNTIDISELVSIAESEFRVEIDLPTTSDMTIYDDFDAHLWNTGHILCRAENRHFG